MLSFEDILWLAGYFTQNLIQVSACLISNVNKPLLACITKSVIQAGGNKSAAQYCSEKESRIAHGLCRRSFCSGRNGNDRSGSAYFVSQQDKAGGCGRSAKMKAFVLASLDSNFVEQNTIAATAPNNICNYQPCSVLQLDGQGRTFIQAVSANTDIEIAGNGQSAIKHKCCGCGSKIYL